MSPTADSPPLKRLSIASYLGIGLGGLMATALALLLWVTLSAVFKNTTELLNDKSRILLGSLTTQTRRYLDAALAPSNFVASEIASGRIDPRDDAHMEPLMRSLLAATPQVTAMAFFDTDGTRITSFREEGDVSTNREPWPDREAIRSAMADAETTRSLAWGPPINEPFVGTFVNYRHPVFREDEFLGMMAAVINVHVLSAFIDGLQTEIGQNVFILYDRDYVLAHRRLIEPFPGLNAARPLPTVTEIGDPVLAGIWREGWEEERLMAGSGHFYDRDGTDYIFLYESLDDYADAPWLVGSYFSEDAVATQIERMVASGMLSLLIIILAVGAVWMFGRFLRRPIADLADAASRVRGLDFDHVPVLRPSRVAELDNAGRAFNTMVAALSTFSRYVPKGLVMRLVEAGGVDGVRSEVKPVTVMMTDIVGFTARAERMGAEETADFLNAHLAMVTACIEAEGGIVDKYMGDGVMALWGAIDPEPDQAARAVRAALSIQETLGADNRGSGGVTRLRIGIHSGDVVAGNIGTETRMNYTVVGDTVNMAQRLENLGKELLPDAEIAVLMSAETAAMLDSSSASHSLGFHELRGRAARSEVFTLAK